MARFEKTVYSVDDESIEFLDAAFYAWLKKHGKTEYAVELLAEELCAYLDVSSDWLHECLYEVKRRMDYEESCNTHYIDYYSIEQHGDRKFIHYGGFVVEDESGYADEQLTFCYVPVSTYSSEALDAAQQAVTHYKYDIDDIDEWEDYGEHLPLNKVTEDTPCGDYWCYIEEE